MADEFLGVGWKFPVQIGASGEVSVSRYEDDVAEAIRIVLGTAPGERVMRPDFGCGIHEFVFSNSSARTIGLIKFCVEDALARWEPRIDVESVQVEPSLDDPAQLIIRIDYRVRSTDSRANLVYPFYLQREQPVQGSAGPASAAPASAAPASSAPASSAPPSSSQASAAQTVGLRGLQSQRRQP